MVVCRYYKKSVSRDVLSFNVASLRLTALPSVKALVAWRHRPYPNTSSQLSLSFEVQYFGQEVHQIHALLAP